MFSDLRQYSQLRETFTTQLLETDKEEPQLTTLYRVNEPMAELLSPTTQFHADQWVKSLYPECGLHAAGNACPHWADNF